MVNGYNADAVLSAQEDLTDHLWCSYGESPKDTPVFGAPGDSGSLVIAPMLPD